ncbi:helix-turn-helix domain-containing protein [Butyrivibrio sp. XBB1001]|uniref:helix-turn-helix domain-containing protein n=1 Tax=Butyrivibrio sp. XBB1001 TaxID=1280682 RepID=UPI000479900F|nr:helix-turn-helix transcriptional regulator [Butyrivibrio sp. XBB1001]
MKKEITKSRRTVAADMNATTKMVSKFISESGLSDKEIAEAMGLKAQTINKWRHGNGFPDVENLFMLSRILGIQVDDFFVIKTDRQLQ